MKGQCAKCQLEGWRYGYIEDSKAKIFPISSGIYKGLSMCAECCVETFGHAEPKNL